MVNVWKEKDQSNHQRCNLPYDFEEDQLNHLQQLMRHFYLWNLIDEVSDEEKFKKELEKQIHRAIIYRVI